MFSRELSGVFRGYKKGTLTWNGLRCKIFSKYFKTKHLNEFIDTLGSFFKLRVNFTLVALLNWTSFFFTTTSDETSKSGIEQDDAENDDSKNKKGSLEKQEAIYEEIKSEKVAEDEEENHSVSFSLYASLVNWNQYLSLMQEYLSLA